MRSEQRPEAVWLSDYGRVAEHLYDTHQVLFSGRLYSHDWHRFVSDHLPGRERRNHGHSSAGLAVQR